MPITFNCEKLIVVEGGSDKAFFNGLLNNRNISGFDVICPWDMKQGLEGEDAIKQLLNSLPVHRSFVKLKTILIVVDSDEDPSGKFTKFQAVLHSTDAFMTNLRYPVPSEPKVLASGIGCPMVAILLLPSETAPGAMESLCWSAGIQDCSDEESCINTFLTCVGADNWSPQKKAKFRLRSLISIKNQTNPDLPTTKLWEKAPDIVPLNSDVFTPLTEYLRTL